MNYGWKYIKKAIFCGSVLSWRKKKSIFQLNHGKFVLSFYFTDEKKKWKFRELKETFLGTNDKLWDQKPKNCGI